ncbi:MAG: hypothetical protein R3B68_11505 [Phycisphaerales bacterium]
MPHALTRYNVLYQSVRSRRRRPTVHLGVDGAANWIGVKARSARISLGFLRREARAICAMAPEIRGFSEAVLDDAVGDIREVFVRQRQDDSTIRRAMALVREVARRQTGEEAFEVQLMGAMALYHGRIVQMLTGEGKTLTGSIAAPLIAWQRRHVHFFTVNDYLARRDAHSRAEVYKRCRVTVGAIQQEQDPRERFGLYARHIVYGTPKQITADYLRDQLRLGRVQSAWAARLGLSMLGEDALEAGAGPMVPGLEAAIVDEADAVLIDEGVVPLIIARSTQQDEMAEVYRQAARMAAKLDEGPDYKIDHVRRKADLKRRGEHRAEQMWDELDEPIWRATRRAEELIKQALVAKHCYIRGQQYAIVEGRVVIVDEYTGRFLPDRSWEHGLHQAVEAKEGLDVTADRETLARLSFQRFFRMYPFLCGMTGTAADATREMERVYDRAVMEIPTNRPVIRKQWPARVFRSAEAKWEAVAASIADLHAKGRPVLVGTRSIAASEHLSELLKERGLEHQVLNANFDKDEAELIARAGAGGADAAITVATNMAGRGTDIKLDEAAHAAGGLHVVLTEMHSAKRIDRQFIGRAGRQGDPGSAQTFVSLDDEIVRQHAPALAATVAARPGGEERSGALALRVFEIAQRRAQARDRRNRASVMRQDDWIDKYLPGG